MRNGDTDNTPFILLFFKHAEIEDNCYHTSYKPVLVADAKRSKSMSK